MKILVYVVLLSQFIACSGLILNPGVKTNFYGKNINFHVDNLALVDLLNSKDYRKSYSNIKKELLALGISDIEEQIKYLNENYSLDYSTYFLLNYIYLDLDNVDINLSYQKKFSELLKKRKLDSNYSNYHFLFVPGWLYISMPETGADFKKIRDTLSQFHLSNELLATKENTNIRENAEIIINRIKEPDLQEKKVILVGVSKAGPEVAFAIKHLGLTKYKNVVGWINISGLIGGTPLAELADIFPYNIANKLVFGLYDLDSSQTRVLKKDNPELNRLNEIDAGNIKVANMIGVPFYDQVSLPAWYGHQLLASKGPNDGRSLIIDELVPGKTIVEVGLDHYYLDPDLTIKTLTVAVTMIEWIEAH